VSGVGVCETDWGFSRQEDFLCIVAIRSEDEADIWAGEGSGRGRDQGSPAPTGTTCIDATAIVAWESARLPSLSRICVVQ
jgi:hypothetical protein